MPKKKLCQCCQTNFNWRFDRACPRCGLKFEFVRSNGGWGDALERHWRSTHAADLSFEELWDGFCQYHREFVTVLVNTSLVHDPLVRTVFLCDGVAEIGIESKPGKHRSIIEALADELDLSEKDRKLTIGDINPKITPSDSRFAKNAWFYSLLVSIQQMKYRPYEGYQRPFFMDGQKRGTWRLTDDSMDWGQKLTAGTNVKK